MQRTRRPDGRWIGHEPSCARGRTTHAVRAASLSLLESLTPQEWEHHGIHSESGAYSVDRWLEIYASHPHEHAAQIRAARG